MSYTVFILRRAQKELAQFPTEAEMTFCNRHAAIEGFIKVHLFLNLVMLLQVGSGLVGLGVYGKKRLLRK